MKLIFSLATVLIVVTLLPGVAVAQEGNETTLDDLDDGLLEELEANECNAPVAIDQSTVLCSASVDGDRAELVLRSDRPQRVTLTDAGAIFAGGPISRTRHQLRPGEANTVTVPITRVNGGAGVTVDTGRALHGVPLEEQSTLIGGPWTATDTQIVALTAGLSTAIVSGVVVLRAIYGRTDKPERIA